jgi:hypothetical protein
MYFLQKFEIVKIARESLYSGDSVTVSRDWPYERDLAIRDEEIFHD